MSDFICTKYDCPNRTCFGYCGLTACNQICPQIRWTDKLSLDYKGNIRDFAGNIVGHYDISNLPDYTADIPRSIEFVVKENDNGNKF